MRELISFTLKFFTDRGWCSVPVHIILENVDNELCLVFVDRDSLTFFMPVVAERAVLRRENLVSTPQFMGLSSVDALLSDILGIHNRLEAVHHF